MTTAEINASRLDILSGQPFVVTVPPAEVDVHWGAGCRQCAWTGEEWLNVCGGDGWSGRPCPHCQCEQEDPPADFAAAVAEVMARPPVRWTAAQHATIDGEHVGEEVSRQPYLY